MLREAFESLTKSRVVAQRKLRGSDVSHQITTGHLKQK
jgi:hypothetical protein